jgi:hypothetical protein
MSDDTVHADDVGLAALSVLNSNWYVVVDKPIAILPVTCRIPFATLRTGVVLTLPVVPSDNTAKFKEGSVMLLNPGRP